MRSIRLIAGNSAEEYEDLISTFFPVINSPAFVNYFLPYSKK
jgi:hypothetical protein